jgi:hypothetical protein
VLKNRIRLYDPVKQHEQKFGNMIS